MKIVKVGVFHKAKKIAREAFTKRSGIALISLANHASYYAINIGLGSPAQEIPALLDTGSGSLWVHGPGSDKTDIFNADKSSTLKDLNQDFSVGYVSSEASGVWVQDKIAMGPFNVDSFNFGLVNSSTTGPVAIFGVGFSGASDEEGAAQQNICAALKKNGDIRRQVYSLYLDDLDSSKGSVIFGGMDASKYTGDLYKIPLTTEGAFEVEITGMAVGNVNYQLNEKPKARVDSGASFCYLPKPIIDQIGQQLGAKYDEDRKFYFISESELAAKGNPDISFNFNGAVIKVASSEIFLSSSKFMDNAPADRFLAMIYDQYTSNVSILGDVFLRSAYTIFDIEGKQVAFGQAVLDGGDKEPVYYELTGPNIPGAIDAPGAAR